MEAVTFVAPAFAPACNANEMTRKIRFHMACNRDDAAGGISFAKWARHE
jgi:hypothetical protein